MWGMGSDPESDWFLDKIRSGFLDKVRSFRPGVDLGLNSGYPENDWFLDKVRPFRPGLNGFYPRNDGSWMG